MFADLLNGDERVDLFALVCHRTLKVITFRYQLARLGSSWDYSDRPSKLGFFQKWKCPLIRFQGLHNDQSTAMVARCKFLVLDSGPILSLSPLRGLADTYLTVPQVLDELKDKRAREHFEQLGLSTGVQVNIRNPDSASLSQGVFFSYVCKVVVPIDSPVIQFAKKTGDYSVLSHADICVLALTHTLHEQEKALDNREQKQAR